MLTLNLQIHTDTDTSPTMLRKPIHIKDILLLVCIFALLQTEKNEENTT